MISRMGRSKTWADRAVTDKKPQLILYFRFTAGAWPVNILFNDIAADEVGKNDGTCCHNDPPPGILFKIHKGENEEE